MSTLNCGHLRREIAKEETDRQREKGKKEEILKKTDYTSPHTLMRKNGQEQRHREQEVH